jgi:hypothetical protein
MYGWRDKAHCYRRLSRGAVSRQARQMLEELAQEADAIAADLERKSDTESEIHPQRAA